MSEPLQQLVLVTGPAGAGRQTALRALEDLGFETIDNLPLGLMPRVLEGPAGTPLALGVDARARDFEVGYFIELLSGLRARADLDLSLVYLDCESDVLQRRYSETRRRHPLAFGGSALDGIAADKDLMAPIRDSSDIVIDTSALSVHDLRAEIDRHFAPRDGRMLSIQIQSFSYKRGLPQGLDMVFDVRFLRNPHWEPSLRPLTGQSDAVASYVKADALFAPFYAQLIAMLDLLLPAYKGEGKSYLTIGFGCTGGKHRSVATTEALADTLRAKGLDVSVRHREIERNPALAVRQT